MAATVVPISTAGKWKNNFQWSFRPILNWFRFLGIPFQLEVTIDVEGKTGAAKPYCNCLIKVFGIAMFLANLARLFFYIIFNFSSLSSNSLVYQRKMSSTTIWNDFLDYFNEFFISLGTQLMLLTYTLVKWKELVAALARIEQHNIFNVKTFHRFRRIFLFGLSITVVVL